MSYDISLEINTGFEDREVVDVGNITYNITPMFVKSMGKNLSDFNDKKCREMIPILRIGVIELANNPEKYRKLNPVNGWGNYDGALNYLRKLLVSCEENPNCTIKVY